MATTIPQKYILGAQVSDWPYILLSSHTDQFTGRGYGAHVNRVLNTRFGLMTMYLGNNRHNVRFFLTLKYKI